MSIIGDLIRHLRRKPPVIQTAWGAVTESARRQAAYNIRDNSDLREKVRAIIVREVGEDNADAEMRRRYPEAFDA